MLRAAQRNFGVAKVGRRHAICPRVCIGNARVCTGERERKVFARAQTRRRARAFAAHKHARPCTTWKMTGHNVFELDSTRKYFTRANTRRRIVSFPLTPSRPGAREDFLSRSVT